MDKQAAIETAKREHEQRLETIELCYQIYEKIKDSLPQEWQIYFSYGHLDITKYSNADAAEFRVVCDLVEKASGEKVSREVADCGYLHGSINRYLSDSTKWISIHIWLCNIEGCKITKRRKMRYVYEADPKCLGLQSAGNND